MDEEAAWVYITPNSRYVFREVLVVLDVRAWRQFDLSAALSIPNYTKIEGISRDGHRLLISSWSCPYDCKPDVEYFELTLPR